MDSEAYIKGKACAGNRASSCRRSIRGSDLYIKRDSRENDIVTRSRATYGTNADPKPGASGWESDVATSNGRNHRL
jgi:hypothetical protein